jgi:hypothetical protein
VKSQYEQTLKIASKMVAAYVKEIGWMPSKAYRLGMRDILLWRAMGYRPIVKYRRGSIRHDAYRAGQGDAWRLDTAKLFDGLRKDSAA